MVDVSELVFSEFFQNLSLETVEVTVNPFY